MEMRKHSPIKIIKSEEDTFFFFNEQSLRDLWEHMRQYQHA